MKAGNEEEMENSKSLNEGKANSWPDGSDEKQQLQNLKVGILCRWE